MSPVIRPPQSTIEINGNHGTNGTRKARGRSGCRRRSRITPSDTNVKANSVPMFEIGCVPDVHHSRRNAHGEARNQVDQCGVLKRGWTAGNFGSKPSRDIAYQMRACPY